MSMYLNVVPYTHIVNSILNYVYPTYYSDQYNYVYWNSVEEQALLHKVLFLDYHDHIITCV